MGFNRINGALRSRAGFTMLELTISIALLGIIFSLGVTVGGSAQTAFEEGSTAAQLEAKVKSVLDRTISELEQGSVGTMILTAVGGAGEVNTIQIQSVTDIVLGVPSLSDFKVIGVVQDPNDAIDGVDNDGDGMIDEGHLVMVRDLGEANETTVTLCKNVSRFLEGESAMVGDQNGNGLNDESGFVVEQDGDLLTLSLSLETPRETGQLAVRTCTVSVMLRN